jgi:hypothetical protein
MIKAVGPDGCQRLPIDAEMARLAALRAEMVRMIDAYRRLAARHRPRAPGAHPPRGGDQRDWVRSIVRLRTRVHRLPRHPIPARHLNDRRPQEPVARQTPAR